MTQLFQELMFVDFAKDLKMEHVNEFSVVPQDIQMANALISQYEYCWFKTSKGYKRASTYMVSLADGSTTRMFSIMKSKTKDKELEALKKELTDPKNDLIETYIIGKHIVEENEFVNAKKSTEGVENAKNENNTDEENNTGETVIKPEIIEDYPTETIDTIPIGEL